MTDSELRIEDKGEEIQPYQTAPRPSNSFRDPSGRPTDDALPGYGAPKRLRHRLPGGRIAARGGQAERDPEATAAGTTRGILRFAFGVLVALASLAAAAEPPTSIAEALSRDDVPALREALAEVARTTSVDAAADAFVRAIEAVPRNRAFRALYESALAGTLTSRSGKGYLFVLVPGWLYRTDPETGADLARVRSVLASLGLGTRLVPLDENGTIEANASALVTEVERLEDAGRQLILVSTSKGGPETYLALDRLRQTGRANHVTAWVNIGGLLNGTAVADHWSEWPRSWLAAAGFVLRGHGTASIDSMTTKASRARHAAASLPSHLLVVNYLGVPTSSDVHGGVRERYELLAKFGPNDGFTLLADAIVPQGITLIEPRYDHFLAMPDLDRRAAALTLALLETLEAGAEPQR